MPEPTPSPQTTPEAKPAAVPPVTEPAKAEAPPEKKLSPRERAAAAWDAVRAAAAERQKEKATTREEPKPAAEAKPEDKKAEPAKDAAPVEKPKEEDALSTKFAQVAKLERIAREKEKAAKARMTELEQREKDIQAKADALEAKKKEARLNPSAWLAEAGLSYDEVTQSHLANGKPSTEAQIQALKSDLEEQKKSREEAAKKQAEEARKSAEVAHRAQYSAWTESVVDFVKQHAADYELIHQQGAHQLVPAVIQQHYQEHKAVLSEKEAADLVEKHLEEQIQKLLQTKKFAEKLKPQQPAEPAQPRTTPTPTLTNGLTASASSSGGKPRTWAERQRAALLAMDKASAPAK